MEVQALQERPRLNRWVQEYWDAFQLLSSSRIVHQGGIGPIPISEIVAYMDATYLTDVDERLKLIMMIQALDSIYVNHINEKAKRESKSRASMKKPAPRRR